MYWSTEEIVSVVRVVTLRSCNLGWGWCSFLRFDRRFLNKHLFFVDIWVNRGVFWFVLIDNRRCCWIRGFLFCLRRFQKWTIIVILDNTLIVWRFSKLNTYWNQTLERLYTYMARIITHNTVVLLVKVFVRRAWRHDRFFATRREE